MQTIYTQKSIQRYTHAHIIFVYFVERKLLPLFCSFCCCFCSPFTALLSIYPFYTCDSIYISIKMHAIKAKVFFRSHNSRRFHFRLAADVLAARCCLFSDGSYECVRVFFLFFCLFHYAIVLLTHPCLYIHTY